MRPTLRSPVHLRRCIAKIVEQVEDALAYAHGHSIVHRDIHGELDARFGKAGTWNDAGNDARQHVFITEWDEIPRDWSKLKERIQMWNEHHYLFVPERMNWEAASLKCKALGGNLVTISDEAENAFVAKLCGKLGTLIGLTDKEKEGVWKWQGEEPLKYKNWIQGQPDNFGKNEKYVEMLPPSKGNGLASGTTSPPTWCNISSASGTRSLRRSS
jgi:hypothetical protein